MVNNLVIARDAYGSVTFETNVGGVETVVGQITGSSVAATGGAWTVGPASATTAAATKHVINGKLDSGATSTADQGIQLWLGANAYLDANFGTRNSTSTTGGAFKILSRTADGNDLIQFYGNLAADGATTSATKIASSTNQGAWTLGASGGTQAHTVNGASATFSNSTSGADFFLRIDSANATAGVPYLEWRRTSDPKWRMYTNNTANNELTITANSGTSPTGVGQVGQITQVGTWTIGPTGSVTGASHQINGTNLRLTTGTTTNLADIAMQIYNPNSAASSSATVLLRTDVNGAAPGGTISAINTGTPKFQLSPFGSSTTMEFARNGGATVVGSYDATGTWTIGPSGAGSVAHNIQNNATNANTLTTNNLDTTTSSDNVVGIRIIKGSTTSTTAQRFMVFDISGGGTHSGSITANGANAAVFTSTSDQRLKENIVDLPSQLANVMALQPREFDFKDGSGHQIGFIAQEIQSVYSDAVGEQADGYLTVSGWSKTDARMVKALQELKQQLDTLKADYDAYKISHP